VSERDNMTLPLQVVDAFTAEPFRGNPAAVVRIDNGAAGTLDDAWMQSVAAEMKHSETAFLRPRGDGDFDLRWFTPVAEIDLCGHATLASAHALWDWGVLDAGAAARFHTRSGLLIASRREDEIEMEFPATPATPTVEPAGLLAALGLDASEVLAITRSDFYVLVEIADDARVRTVEPTADALLGIDVRAVIVTAVAGDRRDYDIVSRVFGPKVGILEDPVTGSAHCVLAPHYAERFGPELRAFQASKRGGTMQTRLEGDRVYLRGHAVTVVRGVLTT
jgi:PhzF family phenazine biosynthesis protein